MTVPCVTASCDDRGVHHGLQRTCRKVKRLHWGHPHRLVVNRIRKISLQNNIENPGAGSGGGKLPKREGPLNVRDVKFRLSTLWGLSLTIIASTYTTTFGEVLCHQSSCTFSINPALSCGVEEDSPTGSNDFSSSSSVHLSLCGHCWSQPI